MTTLNHSSSTTKFINNSEVIASRLKELQKEWDLERVQDLNNSLYELHGTLLGKILNKHFTELPVSTTMRLAQEAGNNWNPPAAMFKSLGYRTKEEIEKEKNALINKMDADQDFGFSSAAVA